MNIERLITELQRLTEADVYDFSNDIGIFMECGYMTECVDTLTKLNKVLVAAKAYVELEVIKSSVDLAKKAKLLAALKAAIAEIES